MVITAIIVLLICYGIWTTLQERADIFEEKTDAQDAVDSELLAKRFKRRTITRWLVIGGLITLTVGFSATSTTIYAFYAFDYVRDKLVSELGLAFNLATFIAAIAALPAALAIKFSLSSQEWKRNVGLAIWFAAVASFSLARYLIEDELTFSLDGKTKSGYALLDNGKVKRCGSPGAVERTTGAKCHYMIPEVAQYLNDAKENKPPIYYAEKPEVFFNLNTGEATVWFCEMVDGGYRYSRIPIRNPETGQPCESATRALVRKVTLPPQEREPETKKTPIKTAPAQLKAAHQAPTKIDHLKPALPLHHNFEGGSEGVLKMSGGWKLDALPENTQCYDGNHCACVYRQGTIRIPIKTELTWKQRMRVLSFAVFGRDVRISVSHNNKIYAASGASSNRVVLNHNVIEGNRPPLSWAQTQRRVDKPQKPKKLSAGWKTITASLRAAGLAKKREPRRTHQRAVREAVPYEKEEDCDGWDYVGDIFPFIDKCIDGRIMNTYYRKQITGYNTIVDYDGATVYGGTIFAQLSAKDVVKKKTTFSHLTPRMRVFEGELLREELHWDGGPPETPVRMWGFEIKLAHPYDGMVCVDDIKLN